MQRAVYPAVLLVLLASVAFFGQALPEEVSDAEVATLIPEEDPSPWADSHGEVFLEFANGAKKTVTMAPSTRYHGQAIGVVRLNHGDSSDLVAEDVVRWSSSMNLRFLKGKAAVAKGKGGTRELTLMGKLNKINGDELGETEGWGVSGVPYASDCNGNWLTDAPGWDSSNAGTTGWGPERQLTSKSYTYWATTTQNCNINLFTQTHSDGRHRAKVKSCAANGNSGHGWNDVNPNCLKVCKEGFDDGAAYQHKLCANVPNSVPCLKYMCYSFQGEVLGCHRRRRGGTHRRRADIGSCDPMEGATKAAEQATKAAEQATKEATNKAEQATKEGANKAAEATNKAEQATKEGANKAAEVANKATSVFSGRKGKVFRL